MKLPKGKYLWLIIALAVILLVILFLLTRKKAKRRKIADLAIDEHAAWNFGKIKETSSDKRDTLTQYWNAANAPDYGYGAAWSAAFISWLFKSTGAGDKFPYASSHSVYIRKAVENRKTGKRSGLIGFRPEEYAPRIGDLICYPRQSGVTFDSTHSYQSHCDLVVDIDKRSGKVITIGGNVSNSVSKTIYDIDSSGKVITPKVHAVLKNAI